ncbi:carboxymuconolactone decarboxylase family protein [Conexibacter woesei]|uniref:Carboxymuconolactone decarboxylase n=1 Tax=Conexibacter woesei (strain DSM 14684 / CCUG 47730 / CIP 108061 / JCM 11494 / NBRC 100937 / ID131577) TaxID=469383 RepID=D3F853_CONWI|nr:carboxymuconolactone decarboxylase family protein [Conexibacter woesei]ADB48923.1 Carboxymuconolactone decarboxylase [Conexibacter woesei DSM 14684]
MASTPRIPKTELTGFSGRLVKIFTRRMLGAVPEPVEVMWHNPTVVKDMSALGRKTMKWKHVDPNLKSFAHMTVASLIGCSWCLDFGYFHAHNEGLDEAKAREVPRWRDSDVFTPLERDVMEYAEAMSQTPPTVTDELVAALLKQLGAPGVVELTSVIAFANMSSRGNVALGIEAQGFAASCELRPLAQRSGDVASFA